jgi:hypothetical protein
VENTEALSRQFPLEQGVEKRHERRQNKAKFGEKAEFMCDK